jgi:hypothetical protein
MHVNVHIHTHTHGFRRGDARKGSAAAQKRVEELALEVGGWGLGGHFRVSHRIKRAFASRARMRTSYGRGGEGL